MPVEGAYQRMVDSAWEGNEVASVETEESPMEVPSVAGTTPAWAFLL